VTKDEPEDAASEQDEAFRIVNRILAEHGDTPVSELRKRDKKAKQGTKVAVVDEDDEVTAATLKLRDRKQTMKLRFTLAWFTMGAVAVQLLTANVLFALYLSLPSWRENTPPVVIVAWLSATVVEVIGIVLVIARNLFPGSEKTRTRKDLMRLLVQYAKHD
jgi:hypothetical protein